MSIRQVPIGSGFGAASTSREVIDGINLSGKIAVVTGGYSGLGRETARTLLAAGARVIVPARDLERAEASLAGVDGVEVEKMDLLDPRSIDAFAGRFLAHGLPLHILVHSAGIMACPFALDSRGFEAQFATNHLGHFHLAERLMPALRKADGARVISVSSLGHRRSPVVFDDIHFEHRPYDRWTAYGQSKTANILFAVGLDARGKDDSIRAFSLHPGSIVGTGLEKHLSREELQAGGVIDELGNPVLDPARQMKTVEQGAATIVWCATSPDLEGLGGVYCENCDVAGLITEQLAGTTMKDAARLTGVMPYAIDAVAAERLWAASMEMLDR